MLDLCFSCILDPPLFLPLLLSPSFYFRFILRPELLQFAPGQFPYFPSFLILIYLMNVCLIHFPELETQQTSSVPPNRITMPSFLHQAKLDM